MGNGVTKYLSQLKMKICNELHQNKHKEDFVIQSPYLCLKNRFIFQVIKMNFLKWFWCDMIL